MNTDDRIPYTMRLSQETVYMLRAFAKTQRNKKTAERVHLYDVVEPAIQQALRYRFSNGNPGIYPPKTTAL